MKDQEFIVCEQCGKTTIKKTSNQHFCCNECRLEFYKNQKEEEEHEFEHISPADMKIGDILEILGVYHITFEQYEKNRPSWIRKFQARKKYLEG